MRLLLDQNVSPRVCPLLIQEGHDAVHVSAIGMARSLDEEILRHTREEDRVIVTADSDFPKLLALRGGVTPSVVLLREGVGTLPGPLAHSLAPLLRRFEAVLRRGCIVTFDGESARIRALPLSGS